jgi:hypothetical protein
MKKKRTKAVRKPRPLRVSGFCIPIAAQCDCGSKDCALLDLQQAQLDCDDARRLASWLTRFADWCESRRGK